jgi:hypothetical protein
MNYLLFLYLNLVRGPQIMEERRRKEDAEKMAKLTEDIQAGTLSATVACKKCDAQINRMMVRPNAKDEYMCAECKAKESEEHQREMREAMRMSPFMWFQLFVMLLGLTVFFHRNVMPLF